MHLNPVHEHQWVYRVLEDSELGPLYLLTLRWGCKVDFDTYLAFMFCWICLIK